MGKGRFVVTLPILELLVRLVKRLEVDFIDFYYEHQIDTHLPIEVSVWRTELLLSDFALHKMFTSSEFDGITSLELGAGTDHGIEILNNCGKNVDLNSELFHRQAAVHVCDLDWMKSWPPSASIEESPM